MDLRSLLTRLGHGVRLSYGIAVVGLAGALTMTSAGYAGEGEGPCAATTCAPQKSYPFAVGPGLPPRPAQALFVLVASEEHASRVRAERLLEYHGMQYVDAPATFIVVGTSQEAALVRARFEGDPNRLLIDLVSGLQ